MASGAKSCPIDGRPLPERATGRPATFCSEGCRRAADNLVRTLTREVDRLESQRNDALIEAETKARWLGFDEPSEYEAKCRAEAHAIGKRIKVVTQRLGRLHQRLEQGDDHAHV